MKWFLILFFFGFFSWNSVAFHLFLTLISLSFHTILRCAIFFFSFIYVWISSVRYMKVHTYYIQILNSNVFSDSGYSVWLFVFTCVISLDVVFFSIKRRKKMAYTSKKMTNKHIASVKVQELCLLLFCVRKVRMELPKHSSMCLVFFVFDWPNNKWQEELVIIWIHTIEITFQ